MRNKKLIYLIILINIFAFVSRVIASQKVGKFILLKGKVTIIRDGKFPAIKAKINDPVYLHDIIRTKTGAVAHIKFIDNNVIKIAQRSRVDISEYVPNKSGKLNLPRGKLEAIVPTIPGEKITFEIKTPNAIAGVRGTHFYVLNKGINTFIFVKEGLVYAKNPKFPDKIVILKPMTMTFVAPNNPPVPPKKATSTEIKEFQSGFDINQSNVGEESKQEEQKPSQKEQENLIKDVKSPSDTNQPSMEATSKKEEGNLGLEFRPEEPTFSNIITTNNIQKEQKQIETFETKIIEIPITEGNEDIIISDQPETSSTPNSETPEEGPFTIDKAIFSLEDPIVSTDSQGKINLLLQALYPETAENLPRFEIDGTELNSPIPYIEDISPGSHLAEATLFYNDVYYLDELPFNITKFEPIPNVAPPDTFKLYVAGIQPGMGGYYLKMNMEPMSPTIPNQIIIGGELVNAQYSNDIANWFYHVPEFDSNLDGYSYFYLMSNIYYGEGFGFVKGTINDTTFTIEDNNGIFFQTHLNFVSPFTDNREIKTFQENLQYSNININGRLGAAIIPTGSTTNLTPEQFWNTNVAERYPVHFLGKVTDNISTLPPLIWYSDANNQLMPFNFYDSSATTYDGGGKFKGFFQGTITPVQPSGMMSGYNISANLYAIYQDPQNNLGIMKGTLGYANEINYFDEDQVFSVHGGIITSPISQGFVDFYNELETDTLVNDGIYLIEGKVDNYDIILDETQYMSEVLYLKNENWGIVRTITTGTLSGAPSGEANWYSVMSDQENDVYVLLEGSISSLEGGPIKASVAGYYTRDDINGDYQTGILIGEALGTFNPSDLTWQMTTSMIGIDTTKLLELVANNPDALRKLDIPCVEVDKVTLTGAGNGFSELKMENIVFLQRDNEIPQIWATDKVSGSYTAPPQLNQGIYLSGGSLSATLEFKEWDIDTSRWKADVYGSGQIGSTSQYNIEFKGLAAGKGATSGSGAISGTAAGIVKPHNIESGGMTSGSGASPGSDYSYGTIPGGVEQSNIESGGMTSGPGTVYVNP